jgi:hypothetical protein
MTSKIQADVLKNVNSSVDNLTLGTSGEVTVGGSLNIGGNYNITGTLTLGSALSVGNGGTGLNTLTSGRIPYGNGTSAFSSSANLQFDGSTLGVGVTPSSWWSGARSLQLGVSSFVGGRTSSSNSITDLSNNGYLNSTPAWVYLTTNAVCLYEQSGDVHLWSSAPSGTAGSTIALTERMRIDGAGNLGLGATPSAWFANRKAFQIGAGSCVNASIAVNDFTEIGSNFYVNSGGADTYIATSTATKYRQLSGAHSWWTAASGTANAAITFTQAMTLDQYGSLLVGTTTSPTTTANLGTISTPGTVVMGSSFKRNRIINGNMQVNQRGGYSGTPTPGTTFYSLDRWWVGVGSGSTNVSVQQTSTSGLTGFTNCAIVQRVAGQTNTANIYFAQQIESVNMQDLQGRTIVLSFWAKAGANYSAASSGLTIYVTFGTGTDQTSWGGLGGWTGFTLVNPVNSTLTTSWQIFTGTISVPSNANEMSVIFTYVPVGTALTTDAFFITGVQLEVGSVATPYERQTYSDQLAQCMRYYINNSYASGNGNTIGFNGSVTINNNYFATVQFPVKMRAAPTSIIYDNWANSNFPTTLNIQAAGFGGFNSYMAAGGTGNGYWFGGYIASAEL